jgi:hypothetical protein
MDANEMIDRYVNEVGEHLPRKTRMDIEMELRSLLQDALEEQSDGEPTPKIAAAMLKDFGPPETIAARYRPDEVLIGAQLFPIYRQVLTIVLTILGIVHLVLLGLTLWGSSSNIINDIISAGLSFGRAAFIAAGSITLVFAAIERLAGDSLEIPDPETAEWDPYNLPPVKDPDRINRGEMLVEVVITFLFVAWLASATNWVSGAKFGAEGTGIWVLFSLEFAQFIPWLIASWLLDIVLKTAVLIQGRWSRVTRLLELGTSLFGFYVLYLIYQNGTIFSIPGFNTLAQPVLVIIMLIAALDLLSKVARLIFGRPFMPTNIFKSKLA